MKTETKFCHECGQKTMQWEESGHFRCTNCFVIGWMKKVGFITACDYSCSIATMPLEQRKAA